MAECFAQHEVGVSATQQDTTNNHLPDRPDKIVTNALLAVGSMHDPTHKRRDDLEK